MANDIVKVKVLEVKPEETTKINKFIKDKELVQIIPIGFRSYKTSLDAKEHYAKRFLVLYK